jgi:hypothetical protein
MKTFKTIASFLILTLAIAGPTAQAADLKADSSSTTISQPNPPSWGLDRID